MNNIDIKEYIQDSVISPLERLMNGDNGEKEVNLYEKYYRQGGYPPKDSDPRNMLLAQFGSNTMPYRGLGSGIPRVMASGSDVELIDRPDGNQFIARIWRTTQKDKDTTQKPINTTQMKN